MLDVCSVVWIIYVINMWYAKQKCAQVLDHDVSKL